MGVLLIGGLAAHFRWWDRYVEDALAKWAVGEVARRTDSTYRLVLGDLDFRPLSGSLAFDSAIVHTDTLKNLGRAEPLPVLTARASQCALSGVNAVRLFLRESFQARNMGCRSVIAGMVLVAHKEPADQAPDSLGINAPVERLPRPLGLSRFRIAQIAFPALSFVLRRPGADGEASVVLEHARFKAEKVDFDPTAPPGTRRALSATGVQIGATGLVLRPDTLSEVAIGRLDAGITDSTLRLDSAAFGPTMPDDEWVRSQRYRHDRVRFALDSLAARGVAYRTFLWTGDINIRALDVHGAHLDVLSDRRLRSGAPPNHRTPQEFAKAMDPAFRIDSIRIADSDIAYLERRPERGRPGKFTFDSVKAGIQNFHLPSSGMPLVIDASARLMNEGLLSVQATVPLDAPDFRFETRGELGPMPVTAFNGFLAETENIKLGNGKVDGVVFSQVSANGVVTSTVTPRYRDLSIDVIGKGGGVFGSVKRAVVQFAANAFKVRSQDPEPARRPETARATRRYNPANSWIQFLWFGLRDGLKEVIVK